MYKNKFKQKVIKVNTTIFFKNMNKMKINRKTFWNIKKIPLII